MKFSKNAKVSKNAIIGYNVKIGDNTIIYDNVVIGDNTIIANDCVIGEPLNDYYTLADYVNPKTIIGENALIRSHTIIYAGSRFGTSFSTGHRVTIRENITMGNFCKVGTLSDLQGYSTFGDYCWLHSSVHIGQQSTIGNFVFIYPFVVFTNDPHPPSNICIGPTVGDYSQIAVHTTVLPDVKIGKHVLIGANSLVARDVDDYALQAGNPAKFIKDVREMTSKETGKQHYPWPYRFERGMPWEGIGFENWQKQHD
jgi:acetyltransferase-like isoleucine patch superfamily enzyme